ncbi:MAG TPA: hypothetical protein VL984_00215 [Acidimicrobiales bacterium]|nr:hypothetical protein [Acidimicrobiales bacterium]
MERQEHRTDQGNGKPFVKQHRDEVRYGLERKTWLVWDGSVGPWTHRER